MNIKLLSELVESSKMNKLQIAEACGITPTTLYNVLSGSDAKISTIEALAKVLNVPVGALFDEINKVDIKFSELEEANREIARLKSELDYYQYGRRSTKVIVELDVDDDEFIKMGLKDKVIRILSK